MIKDFEMKILSGLSWRAYIITKVLEEGGKKSEGEKAL